MSRGSAAPLRPPGSIPTVNPSQQRCLQETSLRSLANPQHHQHHQHNQQKENGECPLESGTSEWQGRTLLLSSAIPGNTRGLSAVVGTGRLCSRAIGSELEMEKKFLREHVHKLSLKLL